MQAKKQIYPQIPTYVRQIQQIYLQKFSTYKDTGNVCFCGKLAYTFCQSQKRLYGFEFCGS